jgi:amino acid adenylation domain-containing protein
MKSGLNLIIGLLARAKKSGITILPKGNQLLVRSSRNSKPDQALLEELKEHKTVILQFFETTAGGFHLLNDDQHTVAPAGHQDNIPASFAQERLWTIDQLRGSVDYHLPVLIHFSGEPDQAALVYSIQQVINRHFVLRTVFCESNGVLLQKIMPPDKWSLWPADSRMNTATFLKIFIETPFDLSCDPVIRGVLLPQNNKDHVLALTLHHIASDGWSVAIMIREIIACYNAFKRGIPHQLAPLDIQYSDYAVWQRQQHRLPLWDKEMAYWEQQLMHAAPLELPADFPRPNVPDNAGAVIRFSFDPQLVQQIKTFSNRQGVTLFTTLLTTFQLLLARYTGQQDIIVGTPVANRDIGGVQSLIGLFINTIVVRSQVMGHLSFEALLQQVKDTVRNGFAHGSIPFERVVDRLVKERDGSHTPLFQTVITLQEHHQLDHLMLDDLSVRVEEIDTGTAKFDLTFAFMEGEDCLHLRIEYSTRLYRPERIHRMLRHFTYLLESAIAHPDSLVKEFSLTGPEEIGQLLQQAYFPAQFPVEKVITDLLEEQVAKTPFHTALVFEDRSITYATMNNVANQVAWYLLANYSIQPDTLVAVLLERSEWMPLVLMGILKAGAAYVPIDPEYPKDRIEYILADSGCALVFDERELQRFRMSAGRYSTNNLVRRHSPANLAYVIYTSGTTGKPKGVLIEHRQVVRLLRNDAFQFHFNEEDVWTMFHSYCFDFSVWEMYGALLHGGRLIIVPAQQARDRAAFLHLLQRHQVTVLNQTPSAFYNLDSQLNLFPDTVLCLRYVIFGGEALNPARLLAWRARFPDTKLINMYGITETTVHVTFREITEKDMHRQNSMIGRPIPTLGCYVLDAYQQILPVGIPGELYVGGEGVARGYLNNEALTIARFIPNPYRNGDRLYRTGDKVQLLEDGNLEYLGRMDQQVKIRGYRIEPGEIEAVLLEHTDIQEAVVIARALQDEEMELVAYLTGSASIDIGDVRRLVLSKLPGYMLPAYFVQLDKLPVTFNGKTDRKNLPPPHLALSAANSYKAPSNETEEKLVLLWQQLLQVAPIGVHDNFFEIGGNSLKLVKMVRMVNEHFQTAMAIVTAFHYPNISALAGYLNTLHQPAMVAASTNIIREEIQIMQATLDLLNRKQ